MLEVAMSALRSQQHQSTRPGTGTEPQCPGIDAHRHSHLIYNNSVKNTGPRAVPEDSPGEQTSTRGMRKGASSSSTQSLLKASTEANRKETQRKLTEIQAETAP